MFCCENCRRKHEINTHKIHPDCSICIYGKIILRDPSDSLLQHIKAKHWPLHCLYCGKMFNTIEELILYNKCPKIAPVQNDKENNNTPPISAGQSCVPTSTPLAPHEDESKFLQKMSEMITPVDTIEKKEVSNASPFTPQNEKKNEPYRKRRVTFSDTIEEIDDNRLVSVKKANYELSTPTSSRYSSYFTAEMKTPSLLSIDETDERAQNNLNESVVSRRDLVVTAENETLWESAINDGSESNEHFSIMEIMTSEEECVTYWPSNVPSTSHQTMGIWNSMTSLFKNVLQAFPITQERGEYKHIYSVMQFLTLSFIFKRAHL